MPHPHPGPKATAVGGSRITPLFRFMSGIMFIVVQNQSTLQSGCMSILQGSRNRILKSLFTGGQRQSLVASPQLGPVCPLCQSSPLLPLVLGNGQVSHPHRLLAGVGLRKSKAQKVQSRLAFLCLNLPPTTLLPSSSVRCSF